MNRRSWQLLGHAALDFVILWGIGVATALAIVAVFDLRTPWPFIVGMICGSPSGLITIFRAIDRGAR